MSRSATSDRIGDRKHIPARTLLFRSGDPCKGVYLVPVGRFEVYRSLGGARRQVERTQDELGTTREAVARALSGLAASGIVRREGRTTEILEAAALERRAEAGQMTAARTPATGGP